MAFSKDYQFIGIPFATRSARGLIIDQYAGHKGASSKVEIIKGVSERHEKLGGLPPEGTKDALVSVALQNLPNAEHRATVNRESYWSIGPLELGSGGEWVYCFYFPQNQRLAIRGSIWLWKCNVGHTKRDPFERIQEQTLSAAEDPIIPLLIRTEDATTLEREVHDKLKTEGKHLSDTNTTEDFLTSPSDVAKIYFKLRPDISPKIVF